MFIEELKNGKYRVGDRYKDPITGKWKKVSVTVKDKKKSTIKAAQSVLLDKIAKKLSEKGTDCTLGILKEKYIQAQYSTVKESTAIRNELFSKSACELLGDDAIINNLTAGYVKEKLLSSGKDATGINEFITRFKSFIRWGYDNDYVDNISFLNKLKPIKNQEKKEKLSAKYLEKDELTVLISSMTVPLWRNLTEFLSMTGLRIGEAIALRAEDIDVKNREIHVNKTWIITTDKVGEMTKTEAGMRDVYIQDQLLPLCKELRRVALINRMACGCDLIFQKNDKRIVYGSYTKYLKEKSIAVLGRKITPHALRHTHVSLLAAEPGITLEMISRRVGHEDSKITRNIYFHVTEKLKEKDNEMMRNIKII